jgi:hypothetical protein
MTVGAIANDWSRFFILFVSANDSADDWGSHPRFWG